MKLNGWQRIGVVLSVGWAIGAFIYKRKFEMDLAQGFLQRTYETCIAVKQYQECSAELHKVHALMMTPNWPDLAFVSLAPIPIAWLAVYAVIWICRWIRAGFKVDGVNKT